MSAYVINSYAFAQERIVNGDFSNLTGMTSNVANWWGEAVPFGWFTSATAPSNSNFVVYFLNGTYYANLNTLSRFTDQVGGFAPFSQDIVMPITSNVTLTFFGSNPFNANSWNLGSSLRNLTTNTLLANTLISNTPQTVTLSASNVPAGNIIRIGFWKGAAAQTPALSNVSVIF